MLNGALGKPHGVEMIGVDLFEPAIRRANVFAQAIPGLSNCRFEVADVSAGLPFEDDTFDAINIADVLEHLVDPESSTTGTPEGREARRHDRDQYSPEGQPCSRGSRLTSIGRFGATCMRPTDRGKDTELDEEGQTNHGDTGRP